MTHVTVVGSANLDLVLEVPHLPAPGETILGSDVAYRPGGKGANQAVAAHRLGAEAVLVAATGDDQLGADLRAMIAAEGLDMSMITRSVATPTGIAIVMVAPDGENAIVVAPGANRTLRAQDVPGLGDLLTRTDVLVLQIEVPLPASVDAATRAREAGVPVILNAAPLPALPDPTFDTLLGVVDVLIVNEGEALELAGSGAPADLSEWAGLAGRISELGPALAVITLGSTGAVAAGGNETFVQSAFAVDVVDTTGAGDAFAGALATAFAEKRPFDECLRRACAAGALATMAIGAQAALPTAAQVDDLLAVTEEGGRDA